MQRMDSFLNSVLLLLCGLLAMGSLQTTNALRFRRSGENQILTAKIHSLKVHYNTLGSEWVERFVFFSHLEQLKHKGSCSCQSLVLDGMLNTYEEIFQDMLKKSENKDVKTTLEDVIREVQKLRHKFSKEQRTWEDLLGIHSIKVKNATIQGAALNDFNMVFVEAKNHPHRSQ